MRYKFIALLLLSFISFTACNKTEENKPQMEMANKTKAAHTVTVEEVKNVSSYSYLKVKEGDQEYWMAATRADFKVGQVLFYDKAMEMTEFHSKELNKTFDKVYFVDDISEKLGTGTMTTPQKPVIEKADVSVNPASGGITIAELYKNIDSYKGKTAKVKGKVTKLNNGIMGKNWVHIQDGTSNGSDFDLTITTNDNVNMGDIVVFQGVIAANKDFGYGYSYKVLMEDAQAMKSL